jgi:hypothetical protein
MSREDLILRIEQYHTPHNKRLLREFSTERLAEYLEYLKRMSTPRRRERERIMG